LFVSIAGRDSDASRKPMPILMAAIGGENLKIGLYLQALGDAGLHEMP
jgi:hypothetical protein